ncbi:MULTISPECIES: hypothetical protein [Flavobacterium]|uniref:hypothetical protein n=1 Tax=Flavobacterium TaxID=237 RepID=UPI0011839D65|nr:MULTISPECIES: hypothetical protein [Flavobacterium]MCR4033114.1 hypothetical protein [Flavobacterium panacis]
MKKVMFLFIISILYSCGKDPYPNAISDFRPELQTHLKKLASEKKLPSGDTIARNYITKNCTKNELLELLKCNQPVLRVIAYRTLVNKKDKDYFKILLGHLSDTAKVTWWFYEDAADDFTVSDLLIRKAEDGKMLTKAQKSILVDSVLLKHSYLDVANWMIYDVEPNEKYYALIKQKSKLKTNRCGKQLGACYALSKFKKKEDLAYLKSVFNKFESPCEDLIFKAIEENPDKIYFPVLEKYFETVVKKKKQYSYDDLKDYCLAVAKYKNEESLMLLEKLLIKKNYPDPWYFKHNEGYVFKAIHKYKAPIYDDLYKRLKPKMSEFTIEYLDKPDYDDRKTW